MFIVVMGVSGAGKTTVARALASQLGWVYFDADDFHSSANIAKMGQGEPLSELDREPWLEALHGLASRLADESKDAVLACSALRRSHRGRLASGIPDLHFVFLRADRPLVRSRLEGRAGHFMKADLLDSQFASLEEPEEAAVIDAAQPPESIVEQIYALVGRWVTTRAGS
jgi:gluconokinase